MTIRSRIAPTPSGYLHLGNGVNFVIAWTLTRLAGGSLKLRIDDLDSDRSRPEYVADIFAQLAWLRMTWDDGPSGPDDFYRHHSQCLRLDRYRQVLAELAGRAPLFPCACSRKAIRALSPDGLYPGTCRQDVTLTMPAPGHAIRIQVPAATRIRVNDRVIALARAMGDFVVWGRDNRPSYQLASLVDDLDDRVGLIVRGEDLLDSTAAQLYLAECLDVSRFRQVVFHHHPLLTCADGRKLSKSDGALSLRSMREQGAAPALVYRAAAARLGITPEGLNSLDGLLAACAARSGVLRGPGSPGQTASSNPGATAGQGKSLPRGDNHPECNEMPPSNAVGKPCYLMAPQ